MKLVDVIKDIQLSLHYSSINSGGCIHFAYYLSKQLTERKIKHRVVGLVHSHLDLSGVQEIGCKHVVIYIPRIGYVDSESIRKTTSEFPYFYFKAMILDIDLDLFRNKKVWNRTYKKSYNSTISRVINSKFQNLTK